MLAAWDAPVDDDESAPEGPPSNLLTDVIAILLAGRLREGRGTEASDVKQPNG